MATIESAHMVRFGWKIGAVLAAAGLMFVTASVVALRTRGESSLAREARGAFSQGRIDAADEAVSRWLAAEPRSAEAHLLRGRIALERKQPAEAAEELRLGLGSGPSTAEAVLLRALIASAVGWTAEAEPVLSQAFGAPLGGPDRQVDAALAKIRIEAFDFDRAGAVLDRWARDFPGDARPHLWRAEIHSRTGGGAGAALDDYRAALRIDPNLTEARFKLAKEFGEQHQSAEALAEYETVLRQQPCNVSAHLGAMQANVELGDEAGASRHLEQALALAPEEPGVHRAIAEAAARREDWPAMLGALDRAIGLDPHDLTTHYRRGVALTQLGRVEEARAEQMRAAELRADLARLNEARARLVTAPHDRASQLVIARWMFDHAHTADGVRWAEQLLRDWPDDPTASRLLADHYRRSGDPGLASFYELHAAAN